MSNIVPYGDIERMAVAVAKSQLFGMKTPDQAIALMLVAQSENLHPARAAMEYHVIQGRPALKADAMLARFQQAGGKVEWKDYTDEKVVGVFSHAQGGTVTIDWSIERAKQAGVYGKNPTWKSYPRAMLRARCISEGIRTVYPGVSVGIYTPEEVQDFAEKDITPAPAPSGAPSKPAPMPEAIKASKEKMKSAAPKSERSIIEGVSTVVPSTNISGDTNEGNLDDVGAFDKPADELTKGKVVHAFAQIGFTKESLEKEYGKPMSEWMESDIPELREVLKSMKIEQAHAKAKAAEMANGSADTEV